MLSASRRSDLSVFSPSNQLSRRNRDEEKPPIKIRKFDNSAIIASHRLSLVGRMFHKDSRSRAAIIVQMPRNRIWNVEERVKGHDLGNGHFQFDFNNEEDLQKVLRKRPCYFNDWSFSLERWEPNIREDFPNRMTSWIHITGVPSLYWDKSTYEDIGDVRGEVKAVDVRGNRIQFCLNADNPLTMESTIEFDNGDKAAIQLRYENLFRYCFTCHHISHEESTCPLLSEEEKNKNREKRAVVYRAEEREQNDRPYKARFSRAEKAKAPMEILCG